MSFLNKVLLKALFENQEKQSKEITELKRLKNHFKESEEARKAKEWANKEETQKRLDGYLSEFFLKNRVEKEVSV